MFENLTNLSPIALAALGTGFTCLMTALGAATVFFFRKEVNPSIQRVFLGFAAGVMIAASVWSLLIPAIELAEEQGMIGWLPAAGGFVLGILFLLLLDAVIPHLHPGSTEAEGPKTKLPGSTLMVLAVTLHNIPEGMAVGLSRPRAATGSGPVAAALGQPWRTGAHNSAKGGAASPLPRTAGTYNTTAYRHGPMSGGP